MQKQHCVSGDMIDFCFDDYKLTIEIDEHGHRDRNVDYELKNKKQYNKNLVATVLELILTKKTLIFLKLSKKCSDRLNNRLIN